MARRRTKKPTRKATWGGYRRNSGRPAMFAGKTVKVTVKLTPRAVRAVLDRLPELAGLNIGDGPEEVSFSDAIEFMVRKANRMPLEDR